LLLVLWFRTVDFRLPHGWKTSLNTKLDTLLFEELEMVHFLTGKIFVVIWWIFAVLGIVGGILIKLYYPTTIPFSNGGFDLGLVTIFFGLSMAFMALMVLRRGGEEQRY
jgi:hypothetical protein